MKNAAVIPIQFDLAMVWDRAVFFILLIKIKRKEELHMNEKHNLRIKRNVGLN